MSNSNEDALWAKALSLIPRGTQTMSKCPDQFVDGVYPKFISKGLGAHLWDLNGNKYLDYMCALGPIILGYNHTSTNTAIIEQLKDGCIFSLPSLLEQELATLITEVVPCAEQVRFAKNGTDADLAAVRIARSYTGREHIVKCGYHGWGDWHGISLRPYGIPSCLKNLISSFEYNNLESLENLLKEKNTAAVIMEAQSLEAPSPGFLNGVRRLCDDFGALLIFDEVVTGFRWALGGAQSHYKVTPDLCCLGKAIANGLPLSAIAGKAEYMKELNHIFFSMTFGGDCLALASGIATLNELKGKDYNHIWNLGARLEKGILDAAQVHGLEINFKGSAPRHNLTFSNTYKDPEGMKALFYQNMVDAGILFPNVIYIQFSHTEEDIDDTIEAAHHAFKEVSLHLHDIDGQLRGKRPVSIFRKS